MRIIDKLHDFYDYLQDPTDRIVFDRRGSFLLTKEDFCEGLRFQRYYSNSRHRFVLLQCGVAYWLFLVTITDKNPDGISIDYDMELLKDWKNYDGPNELIKLSVVSFGIRLWNYRIRDMDTEKVKTHVNDLTDAVNRGNYQVEHNLGRHTKTTDYRGSCKEEVQNLPILKACGIANLVDSTSIFCAIEEHFSMAKTASETTEAKGTTNEDKVVMHGFDVKTSFRKMEKKKES
ncbi:MAG: hypothetical protein E7241_11235 [Lachnospiraceae bacterium]|nr:hypothetical protein [Lachnospiraceae bacterium]